MDYSGMSWPWNTSFISCTNDMTLQHPPTLIATPVPQGPRCLVSWDLESQVISASITRKAAQAHNLAGLLDSSLCQSESERRLVVGDLELLQDKQGLFESLEIRVGPSASWRKLTLPPILNAQGPVDVAFETVFDDNGSAVLDIHLVTVFDSDTSEFSFCLEGSASAHYLKQSDNIHFGMDAQGRLAEVRLGTSDAVGCMAY